MYRVLIVISVGALFFFLLTLIGLKWLQRRQGGVASRADPYQEWYQQERNKTRKRLASLYQTSYLAFLRLPFLKGYVLKIRKRLATLHVYDEFTIRKETMRIAFLTLSLMGLLALLLVILNRSPSVLFGGVLAGVVVNGMLIDTFVNRLEDRLLRQLANLLTDVRHQFDRHGMVEEAIYEAATLAAYEAGIHAEKVYEILTAFDAEEQLETYYEVAPNRFLKAFAGISFLVKEYGDKVIQNGSLYLSGLSKLSQEIYLEILRREKLSYLLRGLTAVAVAPVLFIKPIERWATSHFPSMDSFYQSRIGLVSELVIYAVIFVAYILLRKMQENDDGKMVPTVQRRRWEKSLYNMSFVKTIVDRLVPAAHTRAYDKITSLLKNNNSPLTLEWFFVQRVVLGVMSFLVVVILSFSMHRMTIQHVLHDPSLATLSFGKASAREEAKAEEITAYDRNILMQVQGDSEHAEERIREAVQGSAKGTLGNTQDPHRQQQAIDRILIKFQQINSEYYKWYELLLAVAVAVAAYHAPLWILHFQKRIRDMDMKNEVDQFHTIIGILCEMDRMSVETILEWMERFAAIFKDPLAVCLMNFESGAEQALAQLKEEAPFPPFARTVERLQLAVEKIPVRQAFDDLEIERTYYAEQRKQQYERVIEQKASWGRLIGFLPMYALVFLYLVTPLIYMSMKQLDSFYDEINHL